MCRGLWDSSERFIRNTPLEMSGISGYQSTNTVHTRVNRPAVSDGLVGFALDALREALWGKYADRLILLGYEALAKDPKNTLRHLCELLGESRFDRDFDNVEYDASEFDFGIGTPNLPKVQ
jgi:sulfotransferase